MDRHLHRLGDAVCRELQRPRWLAMEFELLRQAALVAQRPGHFLLIQTLERACRGMAGRVEPYLDSAALYQWTQCAMDALWSKDVKALRSRLPALLQASDERVLQALAPTCEAHGVASLMGTEGQAPEVEVEAPLTPAQVPEVSEPAGALLMAPQASVTSELAEAPLIAAQAPEVGPPAPEPVQAQGPGALCAKWSGRHTSLREVPPEGAPQGLWLRVYFLLILSQRSRSSPGPFLESTGGSFLESAEASARGTAGGACADALLYCGWADAGAR